MLGKWENWFAGATAPRPFALTPTYTLGGSWLRDCEVVEDWGCGLGWFRRYVKGTYLGVDGTDSPWADKVVDLTEYVSSVPGIFMRHVLEHNYEWAKVLANAVASFTQRMVLVIFTPMLSETRELDFNPAPGVPDLAFSRADLGAYIDPYCKAEVTMITESQYQVETVFYLEK